MSSRKQSKPIPKVEQPAPNDGTLPLVLVVDDEELVLRMFRRALRDSPVELVTASDGLHALELLQKLPIVLVLSDQRMPTGPQGVDLLDAVRMRWPKVRRILMTGWLDHQLALKAHHHRVLQKDMSMQLLRDIIVQEVRRAE